MRSAGHRPEARQRPTLSRSLLEAVLVWAGLMVVLFALYELIDRWWLANLPSEARDLGRQLRIFAAAFTATIATVVWVVRRTIPSLRQSLIPDPGGRLVSLSRPRLAEWLLGLRWVAVFCLGAVVLVTTIAAPHVPQNAVLPLWLGVVALFIFAITLTALGAQRLSSNAAFVLQVVVDVLILLWLVHHAGGVANPFSAFIAFHAVIIAILIEPRSARMVVGAISGLTLVLAALEASGILPAGCVYDVGGSCQQPDPTLLAGAGIAVATVVAGTGLFVASIIERLRLEHGRVAEARLALLSEREKLQSIINCMADAVIFVTPDGTIRLRNAAAGRLWQGAPPKDEDLRVCHDEATWQILLAKVTNPAPEEYHPILQVGDRSFEASYARVGGGASELRGVVMVARDVTERMAAQEWRMQQERMAVVGKLAAGIAHEINNPIGAVALFSQLALKQVDATDPLRGHWETVLKNAHLCKRIVQDLLQYARQRPPEKGDIDVADLLADTIRTVAPQADRRGVRIEQKLGSVALRAIGDAGQLQQVLVNLALNGIEAMEPGGVLTVGAAMIDSHCELFVGDTGCGIEDSEFEKVFSAFHTTKEEGTGLGLAVVKDIVAAHGGTIRVDSTPGKGSTFSIALPMKSKKKVEAA